jgi:hypothetical protein
MEISSIPFDSSWFPNTSVRVFRRTSILVYIARLSASLWHVNVHNVSIKHRLTHIHCLLKRSCLLFPWMLTRSIILLGYSSPPPFHYRWGINGFLWYLHSFRRLYKQWMCLTNYLQHFVNWLFSKLEVRSLLYVDPRIRETYHPNLFLDILNGTYILPLMTENDPH